MVDLPVPSTAATGGKRAANRERVRSDLAGAAIDLFERRGFDRVTVDEIADAAGISRRTIFRHFPTKSDIVFADHPERIRRLGEFLDAADPERSPLDVVLAAAVATIPSFLDPAGFFLARHRLLKHTPELRVREQAYGLEYTRVLARFLRPRLRALGHAEDDVDVLSDVIAASVVTVVNRAQRRWSVANGDADAVELTRNGLESLRRAFGPLVDRQPANAPSGATVIVMNADGAVTDDVVSRLSTIFDG